MSLTDALDTRKYCWRRREHLALHVVVVGIQHLGDNFGHWHFVAMALHVVARG